MTIQPKVRISFKYVCYSEGDNLLELELDRGISDAYLYVPVEAEWDAKFEWAKGRKQKIIADTVQYLLSRVPNYPIIVEDF